MTPKEKANELVMYKFIEWTPFEEEFELPNAKKCAIIAVNEILDILEINGFTFAEYHDKTQIEYWLDVKNEIEKL